jgi:cytochrome bd-type quinol oxidase subunit 2
VDINEYMAESNERARSGRRAARNMILSAVIVVGFGGFLWIAAPNSIGGSWVRPMPWSLILPAAGLLGIVIGLVWMIRIYRANPEPDPKAWRYRR